MNKTTSRTIAGIMLIAAICFVWYALNHPESSWLWSNTVSLILYSAYILVMAVLFAAPFRKKK